MKRTPILLLIGAAAAVIGTLTILTRAWVLDDTGSVDVQISTLKAQSVTASVTLPFSHLEVAAGAEFLAEGQINYVLPNYVPLVDYTEDLDDGGRLVISQPDMLHTTDTGGVQPSRLNFNADIPLALDLAVDAGSTTLDLTSLALTTFSGRLSSGPDTLLLAGSQPTLTAFSLETEALNDTATIECACPSLLDMLIDGGSERDDVTISGSYPLLERLNLDMGAGNDTASVTGDFPSVLSFIVNLGAGDDNLTIDGDFSATVNLIINIGTGNDIAVIGSGWTQNATITFISEGDSTHITLPSDIGVMVQVASRSNTITAPSLIERDDVWVNSAYDDAEIRLMINVNTTPNEAITLLTS